MTIAPISHTKHEVPGSEGVWRPGSSSHQESGTDLQDYLRPLEQAHAALHGFGVALGLALSATAGESSVRVTPGVAVDPVGRHVVLAPGGFAELSATPDASSALAAVAGAGVALPTDGHTGRCVVTVAWRETFDRALLESSFQQTFLDRHTPWLVVTDPGQPLDDAAVVLGTVDLDAGVVTAAGVGVTGRVGPVPTVQGVRLRRAGPAGGTDVDGGILRALPGGGVRLAVTDAGAPAELRADHLAFSGVDGTERLSVDAVSGRLGVGTAAPSHALHVIANSGIRQNRMYLSGGPGWSSLTYNAHHDDANSAWVFPDPTRPAVTVEMDDNNGRPRFDIWSTTAAAPTAWNLRFTVDGTTGDVRIPGALSVQGGLSAARDNAQAVTLFATNQIGPAFCASSGSGVALRAVSNTMAVAVVGPSSFAGAVDVTGTLTATTKHFVIDHPLDPENRSLVHASVESDERVTVYGGTAVLDGDGAATVGLPDWMEALNGDFRYQLTPVGAAAPVHVAREVSGGSFGIAGGAPGMTVSWQLTGVRRDAWAESNPLVVEEDKPDAERGYFRHPEVHGQDRTRSVHHVRHEDALRRHPRLAREVLDAGFGIRPAH